MTKSYFPRIVALVPFICSGFSIVSKATGHSNGGLYFSNPYSAEHSSWMLPDKLFNKKGAYSTYRKPSNPLFLNKTYEWILMTPRGKKKGEKAIDMVHYQAEDSIVFDAKKKILSLYGGSTLSYDNMQLEAYIVALHLNTNTIGAKGIKDAHNKPIGNPIFTYKDVTKNKYGKDGSTQKRVFFMENIWYNIDTKRALADRLLTKQEESIVKSKQVKKEDEETFYAEDIIYTTCALAHPHFYIRTKRAKMVQDKQITTGPFRFYFDNVPTPLGCVFGTLFLEGKRVYGIIPPEIGESDNGFYLRNGGYYINFNDYVDVSILGSIYCSGIAELENKLRYKKRYLCSGDIFYGKNITEKEKGWSLKWEHRTLAHGPRNFTAKFNLHNKSYKALNNEDKQIPKDMEQESSASLSYNDELIGFPYRLNLRAEFNNNLLSNFKHWTLPKGSLSSASWYPFRIARSKGTNRWFHNIQFKYTIDFENHLQNAKKAPNLSHSGTPSSVPSTYRWNHCTKNGIKHTIPLSMHTKLFGCINLKPHLNYDEVWYWLKKKTKGPIRMPGFNRVYVWNFGAELGTTLYHTHYFEDATSVQGFRIKTEPSVDFTYTPDFSKEYFRPVENEKGEKGEEGEEDKKYVFEGLQPGINVAKRATSVLSCKLHNTVELKVKKAINPEKKEKEKKRTAQKIFLLKNLDFETKYDFKEKDRHLTEGINMHIASEAKMGKMGKIGFDLNTNFDPYYWEPGPSTGKIKEKVTNDFTWNRGKGLARIEHAKCKIHIDVAHHSSKEKKKKKDLFNGGDQLSNKLEDNKIDFEVPWSFNTEFNVVYNRLHEYEKDKKDYSIEQYITFDGSITLVKKWKVNLSSTYNFTKSEFDPSATKISIQRDLHCWQLSYQWHPLGDSAKYDFSLGVKANVLKVLKIPRKRIYKKLN
ncbi:putative LPS assembly protein LptD [Cardinium endosymbiont of Nabis limbatus]|uniref:putative LPS assembly protein LptD n=1 Tax=Cardinium endosymbiont of Nabis limbatus TaxID=3066217 RepID=UPI003AF38399